MSSTIKTLFPSKSSFESSSESILPVEMERDLFADATSPLN